MDDLTITKLCAEAMGLTVLEPPLGNAVEVAESDGGGVYDPLQDDEQAMALVKKFKLAISVMRMGGWLIACESLRGWTEGPDLNRVICECVAKMQSTSAPNSVQSVPCQRQE